MTGRWVTTVEVTVAPECSLLSQRKGRSTLGADTNYSRGGEGGGWRLLEAKTSTGQGAGLSSGVPGGQGGSGRPCTCLQRSYFYSPTSASSIILLQNLDSQMTTRNFCSEQGLAPTSIRFA